MKWFLSSGGYYLWLALDDPEGWHVDTHHAYYGGGKGLHMWVANGGSFFDGADDTPKFLGWFERHILWRKFVRMKQEQVACTIAKLMTGGSK
jgi:hypothetical protein